MESVSSNLKRRKYVVPKKLFSTGKIFTFYLRSCSNNFCFSFKNDININIIERRKGKKDILTTYNFKKISKAPSLNILPRLNIRLHIANGFFSSNFLFLLAAALSSLTFAYAANNNNNNSCTYEYIFQVGDSLADTGNRFRVSKVKSSYRADHLPYDEKFSGKPCIRSKSSSITIWWIRLETWQPRTEDRLRVRRARTRGRKAFFRGTLNPVSTLTSNKFGDN